MHAQAGIQLVGDLDPRFRGGDVTSIAWVGRKDKTPPERQCEEDLSQPVQGFCGAQASPSACGPASINFSTFQVFRLMAAIFPLAMQET